MVSINNLELHLELIYYKLFNRKNTLEEYTKYENYTNLNEIETDLKNTLEYKKLYDKFSGSLVFDEIQCTLQVTNLRSLRGETNPISSHKRGISD